MSYGYDVDGNVTSLAYPSGHQVTRAYDAGGRVTRVSDWGGRSITITRDGAGGHTREGEVRRGRPGGHHPLRHHPLRHHLTYDDHGRLHKVTAVSGHATVFGFTTSGDRTSQTTAGPAVTTSPTGSAPVATVPV